MIPRRDESSGLSSFVREKPLVSKMETVVGSSDYPPFDLARNASVKFNDSPFDQGPLQVRGEAFLEALFTQKEHGV